MKLLVKRSQSMKTPKTPTYKVVKIMRVSGRRSVIERGLTEQEAKRLVASFPNSHRHMVVFYKQ